LVGGVRHFAPCIDKNAVLPADGHADRQPDDDAGCAAGEEEGPSDLSRETSRRMKAGPWIRRAARHCSHTPPRQSRSSEPTVRPTPASTSGDARDWRISGKGDRSETPAMPSARYSSARSTPTCRFRPRRRRRGRARSASLGAISARRSPPPVFPRPKQSSRSRLGGRRLPAVCDSSVSDQLDGRPGVLKGGRATRRAQLLCFGRNVRWGSASARQRRLPLARNESGARIADATVPTLLRRDATRHRPTVPI
jgi:hypothetical protein